MLSLDIGQNGNDMEEQLMAHNSTNEGDQPESRLNNALASIRDMASRCWPATKAHTAWMGVNLYKFYCSLEFGTKALLPHLTSALLFGFIVQMLYLVGIFSYFGEKFRENENDTLCDQKYYNTTSDEIIKRQAPCTDLGYSSAEILDMDIYTSLWLTMQQIFFGGLSNLYLAIRYSYAPIIIAYFARVQYERYFHIQPKYYINHRVRALTNFQTLENYLNERPNQDFSRKIPQGFAYYFQALAMIVGLSFIVGDIALLKSAKIYVDKFEETEEETSENSPLVPQDQNTANASRAGLIFMLKTIAHFLGLDDSTFKGMFISTAVLVGFLLVIPPLLKALLLWSQAAAENDLSEYRSASKNSWTEFMNSDTHLYQGLEQARRAGGQTAVVYDNRDDADSPGLNILENSPASTWFTPSDHPYPSLQLLCANLPDHVDYQINFYNTENRYIGNYTKAHGFVRAQQPTLLPTEPLPQQNFAEEDIEAMIRLAYCQGFNARASTANVIVGNNSTQIQFHEGALGDDNFIAFDDFIQQVNVARNHQNVFAISFIGQNNREVANTQIPLPLNGSIDFDWIKQRLGEDFESAKHHGANRATILAISNNGLESVCPNIDINQNTDANAFSNSVIECARQYHSPLRIIVSFTDRGTEVGRFFFCANYVPQVGRGLQQRGMFVRPFNPQDRTSYENLYNALLNQLPGQIAYFSVTTDTNRGTAEGNRLYINERTTAQDFASFVTHHRAEGVTTIDAYSHGQLSNTGFLAFSMHLNQNEGLRWVRSPHARIGQEGQVINPPDAPEPPV